MFSLRPMESMVNPTLPRKNEKGRNTVFLAIFALSQFLTVILSAQMVIQSGDDTNQQETRQEQDSEKTRFYNDRSKLAEKLFRFQDAYIQVSYNGRYLWVTKTGENLDSRARVWIFEIAKDFSSLQLRHKFELLNPVCPTYQFLSPDARFFVTLDEAGRCGNSPRDLVIYNLEQGTSLARGIDEFLPASVVKKLRAPFYMGGEGLREWQRLDFGLNHYNEKTETLFPVTPSLAKSTSQIPYIAIHLPTGNVTIEPVAENRDNLPKPVKSVLVPGFVQTGWAMSDGTRKIAKDSNVTVDYIALFQPENKQRQIESLKIAYKRDPETGNYLKVDWQEFSKIAGSMFE